MKITIITFKHKISIVFKQKIKRASKKKKKKDELVAYLFTEKRVYSEGSIWNKFYLVY